MTLTICYTLLHIFGQTGLSKQCSLIVFAPSGNLFLLNFIMDHVNLFFFFLLKTCHILTMSILYGEELYKLVCFCSNPVIVYNIEV